VKLQSLVLFNSPDQLPSVIEEQFRNHQLLVSQLREIIPFDEERDLLVTLIQLVESEKDLQREVVNLKEKHSRLTSDLKRIFSCKHDRQILTAAETAVDQYRRLQMELNTQQQIQHSILQRIQSVTDVAEGDLSTRIDELLSTSQTTVRVLESERHASAQFIERLKRIAKFEEPSEVPGILKALVKIRSEHESLSASYEVFVTSIEGILGIEKGNDILNALRQLLDRQTHQIDDLQNQLTAHQEIIQRLSPVISLTSFEELPQIVTKLVDTSQQTREVLSGLQTNHHTLQDEHKTLEETHRNFRDKHEQLLARLSESLTFEDESSLVSSVAKLVSQCASLRKKKKDSNSLLAQLRQMMDCSSKTDLPSAVEKLHQSLAQANDQYFSLLASLHNLIVFTHETELIQQVTQLRQESRELVEVKTCQKQIISALSGLYEVKSLDELPSAVKSLSSTVSEARQLAGIDEVVRLPELIKSNQSMIQELNGQLAAASDFLNKILSRVFKRTVGVTFPLEASLSSKIVKGFEDYADNTEALQANVDALLSTARAIGYSGTSRVGHLISLQTNSARKKHRNTLKRWFRR
jgi:hypothetical protein